AIGLLGLLLTDAVPARNPFGVNVARVEAQGGAVIQGDASHRDEHEEDQRGEAHARMPASQGPGEAQPERHLVAARAVEIERETAHALHRMDRQRGARYAVDAAIQTIALGEASACELLQERGIAHLLAAALAVGQHAYMIDAPLRDHEAG